MVSSESALEEPDGLPARAGVLDVSLLAQSAGVWAALDRIQIAVYTADKNLRISQVMAGATR